MTHQAGPGRGGMGGMQGPSIKERGALTTPPPPGGGAGRGGAGGGAGGTAAQRTPAFNMNNWSTAAL